jgi:hypothetical protein
MIQRFNNFQMDWGNALMLPNFDANMMSLNKSYSDIRHISTASACQGN